jgi:hypothetical protein
MSDKEFPATMDRLSILLAALLAILFVLIAIAFVMTVELLPAPSCC